VKRLWVFLFFLFALPVSAQVRAIRSGPSLPATCRTDSAQTDVFIKTDTDKLYICSATDTWVLDDTGGGGGGSGDVVGPSASVESELPLFSGTSGKTLKRSNSFNGFAFLTNGVVSGVGETGTGTVVRSADPVLTGLVKYGGATSSFPSLKRSSTTLQVRLADDSAYAPLEASVITGKTSVISDDYFQAAGTGYFLFNGRAMINSPASSNIRLTNSAGTSFGLLQFGGTTATYPALRRNSAELQVRLADDSAFGNFQVNNLTINGTCTGCPSGGGSGTINSGVTNIIPKYTASTTIDDSLLSDDGTTLSYSGTGGFALTSGSGAGTIDLLEGTAPSLVANTVTHYAHTDVAAGGVGYMWGSVAAASGVLRVANSSGKMTVTQDAGISHLAASTSADLAGVLSDETGSGGSFVRATLPTLTGADVADYLRLSTVNTTAPAGGDCDASGETGRVHWDSTNDVLRVCSGASGWVSITGGGGSGDVTDVGNCDGPACFTGTEGDTLTFNDADGDKTFLFNTTSNEFEINAPLNLTGSGTSSVGIGDSDNSHFLNIRATSNLSADRDLNFATGDAARTVTISGDPTLVAGTMGVSVANGTSALGTSSISSGACATVVTTSATGTATTDAISWGFNGDPTGVTGYVPSTSGMLTIIAYPSSNNVNFKVCNNTAGSITPGAITLNWRVVR
jgi:hypothetical protein